MKRPIAIAAAIAVAALSTGLRAQGTPSPPPATPEVTPAALSPAEPAAPEKAWSLDLGAEYASRYLFRGVSLLGDKHLLDPHAHFGIGNFGVYYYGYFGEIPDTHDKYQEADFGADHTFSFGEKLHRRCGDLPAQQGGRERHRLSTPTSSTAFCRSTRLSRPPSRFIATSTRSRAAISRSASTTDSRSPRRSA